MFRFWWKKHFSISLVIVDRAPAKFVSMVCFLASLAYSVTGLGDVLSAGMMGTVALTSIVQPSFQAAGSAGIRSLMVLGVSEIVTASTIVISGGALSVQQIVIAQQMSIARTCTYLPSQTYARRGRMTVAGVTGHACVRISVIC